MAKTSTQIAEPPVKTVPAYAEGLLVFCHGCGTNFLLQLAVERACKMGKTHKDKTAGRTWFFHEGCEHECVHAKANVIEIEIRCKACNQPIDEEGMCRNPTCDVW